MPDRHLEVTFSTMGQQNPSQVTLSKPYRWQGIKDWFPGHPDYREDVPRSAGASKGSKSAEAKAGRFRTFCQHRDDGLSIADAAKALGIGSTAARQYEAERNLNRGAQS